MKNVEKRGDTYFVRVVIPQDVRHAFGQSTFTESLRTKDQVEAIERAAPIIAAIKRRIAAARRKQSPLPRTAPTEARLMVVSPDDVFEAVGRWRRDHIQQAYIDHANALVAPVNPFSDEGRQLSDRLYALQRSAWTELSDFDTRYVEALNVQGLALAVEHPIIAKTRHWFGQAWLEAERRIGEFRQGDFSNWPELGETPAPPPATNDTPVAANPRASEPELLRLGQLLDRYIQRERPNEDRRLKTYIRRLSEFLGDPLIRDITTSDMDRFLVQLRRFPRTKRPEVEKMSFSKVVAAYATDEKTPRLTDKTIWANWFVFYKRLFRFAQDRDWIAHNPVSAAMPRKPRKRALERKPYGPEQIAELFSRPMFTGCTLSMTKAGKPYGLREKPGPTIRKDAYYWLPILGLWTGCRVEEMGGAMAADIKQEDGIWFLDLRDRNDLKTDDSSPRPIPLHQGLLNTGFLDYVQTLDPGGRLFPDLPHDPNDVEASTAGFTKWWGRWSDANGFPDPTLASGCWSNR